MHSASKDTVLEQLANLTSLLINGGAPVDLAPHLAGANLTASIKKDGSIKPIAVGEV